MLLILTHENADFDAVASQLGAQKLYPEGTPLLSWRINRNVSQFLNLYWDALNYVKPEDWLRKRVERVVLVDTVSLPSVRGIRQDRVDVLVIDHHAVDQKLKNNWSYHFDQVGATSTILVEMMQAAGLSVTPNEATLLMLGIHEDTGSLVYDTTTLRDVQAVAWLMGQGAQLSVVRRFLNIALSDQQQDLYKHLLEAARWIRIEGQDIVISAVEAPADFDDEISAVAHRLRDALTPDGIFLIVQLKANHVQLVARSGSNNVDVSIIARALGGGGHSRAAAATIMDNKLDDVKRKVQDMLGESVRPMTKVSQIMSYGVQTIFTTTSVSDAAEQMRRFGHEGYPVLDPESNMLVGLLTRRMVDRATSHKLGHLPAKQIMKAGSVTVKPSDSVEDVRRLMIQEGWGQIPVIQEVEENSPEVIGIVTRTDLITLFGGDPLDTNRYDTKKLMANSLPGAVWGLVQAVGDVASSMNMPLYFVGGLVRDLILKNQPTDIDMVVEGYAISLVQELQRIYGGEKRSHAQFGTAKWLISKRVWSKIAPGEEIVGVPDAIDFVTARTEFYTRPTALPEVERGSIKLDLHRRDFTINTLAIRLDGAHLGELLDFYGGRRDLESGLIRVLHSLSFVDDPTRILRAARLEQRLNFAIESRTQELITAALSMLNRVSGDRIRNELEMCLEEPDPISIVDRLASLGVLVYIHPQLNWSQRTAESFERAKQLLAEELWRGLYESSRSFIYFALWMLDHRVKAQNQVMKRLKVRRSTKEDVNSVRIILETLDKVPENPAPSQVYQKLKFYPERVLFTALAMAGQDSNSGRIILGYQREWRHVRTYINGDDLLEMGMEPGPEIGRILNQLLDARLDGVVSDESEEMALLKELINSQPAEIDG
ncbi:MAG: CBS domain-containing protein [Anaerolineae bacterium]|nr:MAG: CBS domain-containing protein [Anaerolineae bacterium]